MTSNISITDDILQELNDEKARVLIPAMIFCGALMLLGTVGNILVIYFYGFKSKTTSATCFILALAIFDLVVCVLGIPIEISDMRLFYLFKNVPACRVLVFINHFAVISSAFTLCFIAVDRFKRICKPFDKQMSVKRARVMCGICAGLGVFLGWPSVALYTVERVMINTTYHGEPVVITGYDCTSVKAEAYAPYLWTFSVVQFVGFLGTSIALIACYFLVGRQLFKHKKFRFYVAQAGLRRTASGNVTSMTTSNTDYSSDPVVNSIPITCIPEEDEGVLEEVEYEGPDDDLPMMQEYIPDLREFLELDAGGLPDVDEDRPTSALREFLDETGPNSVSRISSIRTDASGRSKVSIMTVRSVIICDESENEVYDIEPRDRNTVQSHRPKSARSESTWSNSITRPGSAYSINTISRPSSVASGHSLSEIDEPSVSFSNTSINPKIKSHPLFGSNSVSSGIKRTHSDGCVTTRPAKRTGSNKSNSGKPSGIRRTTSEDSALRKKKSNSSWMTSHLRRTGSSNSAKMNTDTDNVKDIRMKMLDINTIKYTFIMIIIAVVFVSSCVPYLCLAIWRLYSHENLVYEFTNTQLIWFQIGIRSYFLNCAINPFIYGFFNSQFRAYFYKACCSCCARIHNVSRVEGK